MINLKKAVSACSVLCAIVAVLSVVFGVKVLMGGGFFVGLRIFNMAASGTFMGFIGNLFGIVVTALGFGSMALCGFKNDHSSRRKGFICGAIMTVLCVISAIAAIIDGAFTFGDILITALPAIYTYGMLKTA